MKYMGSKSRIKKQIIPIINEMIKENNIINFVDLFCGGCNVVDSVDCENKYANDISEPLIEMFNSSVYNDFIFPEEVSKEFYNDVRENKLTDKYSKNVIGAVGYLASYNGRYFDGGYAKTLVSKNGNVRNYYDEAKRNVIKQLPKLEGVVFSSVDYKKFVIPKKSLVYCDIPYKNTKNYEHSKLFNHDDFWNWAKKTSENNLVVVSEQQAPDEFRCIWQQEVTRTQNNRDRSKVIEKMFVMK